jgi:tetratricopeptide (TPR) repeat protein
MSRSLRYVASFVVITVTVALTSWAWPRGAVQAARSTLPLVQGTSRHELDDAEGRARHRLAADAGDAVATVRLAEVLLRKARVDSDASRAIEAEQVLRRLLTREPAEDSALKLLGAVSPSQHRFSDAAKVARRAIAIKGSDAWNYGVLGDANVELGRYEEAFDAFDTMARLRPDAAAYARVAYAHEVQGRLREALRHMQMAAEATSAHDPESLAWHHAQIGNLYFQMGDLDSARREYARADSMFNGHPYAELGLARVTAASGNLAGALEMYRRLLASAPTPEVASAIGDLLGATGHPAGAGRMYDYAEQLEREGWKSEEPQPGALGRMLAERALKPAEAVRLAERAATSRADIYTMDALAIAYFRVGRLADARVASLRARRTGTVDRRILYHAALIEHALHNERDTRALLAGALDGHPAFDPLIAPAAAELWKQVGASRITR